MASRLEKNDFELENVLVLQGGGSLGAYECGVYKALAKYVKKFDIVAGTSIGAINAAIITATIRDENPSRKLEDFWLELAQSIGSPIPLLLSDKTRRIMSTIFAATWGNPKAFIPKWLEPESFTYPAFGLPYPLFDISPLKETLSKYVDFAQLRKREDPNPSTPRLIVTATDLKTSEAVVFDSNLIDIDVDHIIGCIGFPFYGIGWNQKDGRYLWDGSLLSNTPLVEVINSSPISDKKVYIVNLFPRYQEEIPNDMLEAWHRARDIMYTDRTDSNVRTSKIISRYLSLLKDMHEFVTRTIHSNDNSGVNNDNKLNKEKFTKIEEEYDKLAHQRGAIIQEIVRIERTEESRSLFEDADFSDETIKKSIMQGERDAEKALVKNK
jgi:NTE family protein